MSSPRLPSEVWTLVFRHLPLSDRLRVRASCKYFRDLVDDALWRDWTVELSSDDECEEEDICRMLRRWGVTSALLTSGLSLTHISKELPELTTLRIDIRDFTETIPDLKCFTNLERLYLTLDSKVRLEELFLSFPQRLTHLRVCQVDYKPTTVPAEFPPDSPFKRLKSLAFHCFCNFHPVNALHSFLSSLPQLQHLSLSAYTYTSFEGRMSDLPLLENCSLSSLELLGCETNKFPMDFMKMLSTLPSLRSLSIFCRSSGDSHNDQSEKLSAWLKDLPALTSLGVMYADIHGFVRSIPSSVTRLILMPSDINSEEMTALSAQVPDLRCLHLVPLDSSSAIMALIPRLFPRLKTLRLSHKQIPEDVFLSLASLKELEVLDMQNDEPPPAALVSKLRELTNYRVRIYKKPEKWWLRSCYCSFYIPAHYWA